MPSEISSLGWRRLVAWFGLGCAATTALLVPRYLAAQSLVGHVGGESVVVGFEHPRDVFDVMVTAGDGQAYAALARDPTLSHPGAFRNGPAEAAYRVGRPLLPYLAWLSSLGRGRNVPRALFVWSIVAGGVVVAAAAEMMKRRRLSPFLGLFALLLPGSLASLQWLGPELLGLALVLAGYLAWERGQTLPSATLFALAGLARETYLIVPLVLFLLNPKQVRLLVAPLTWLGWTLIVWDRFGHWGPGVRVDGVHVLGLPFLGLLRVFHHIEQGPLTLVFIVFTLLLIVVSLAVGQGTARWVVAGYAVFATLMNANWGLWSGFTRPLLPLYVFGLAIVMEWLRTRKAAASSAAVNPARLNPEPRTT